ncbi:MAG TPA: hypothetical protein VGH87_01270 [Polyangiaceae bacterium]|jgi:hypothetical protein|nr:hypothetical protein [Polyangiaceae bacterium]
MRLVTTILAAALAIAPLAHAQTTETTPSTLVSFTNELPSQYRLTRVRLVVDGAVRYDGPRFDNATIPRGNHVVEVVADYRMHGNVLTYMNHMGIQVRSAHAVHSVNQHVDARAVRHGGATTPLEKSAVISWVDR